MYALLDNPFLVMFLDQSDLIIIKLAVGITKNEKQINKSLLRLHCDHCLFFSIQLKNLSSLGLSKHVNNTTIFHTYIYKTTPVPTNTKMTC